MFVRQQRSSRWRRDEERKGQAYRLWIFLRPSCFRLDNAEEYSSKNAADLRVYVPDFERKIFRRIYGPKFENEEWKSRTDRELEERNKEENIVKWIKGQRISWLGHLERMEEDRMSKKIFTQELEGTRRRGRPRKGWKEEAEGDFQVLGVRRWRELVADRKNWRTLFDRPKPRMGCSANGRRRNIETRKKVIINVNASNQPTTNRPNNQPTNQKAN